MTEQTHTTPARCPPAASPTGVPPASLEITKLAVDPQMHNNCYLLRCTDTGDQVLIDAADEPERLLELIGDGGLTTVVTTHQHWDHHRALAGRGPGHRRRRRRRVSPTPTRSPSRPASRSTSASASTTGSPSAPARSP